jgi:Domain of unknown function (DU1801)
VTETDTLSQQEVDAYLAALDEPKQSTLRTLRQTILEILPEAEQCISYAIPGFRVRGQMIAGFAAFKNHLSYFPHSGSVTGAPRLRWFVRDKQRHPPVSDRHATSEDAGGEARDRAHEPGLSRGSSLAGCTPAQRAYQDPLIVVP